MDRESRHGGRFGDLGARRDGVPTRPTPLVLNGYVDRTPLPVSGPRASLPRQHLRRRHVYSAVLRESPRGRFRLDIDYGCRQDSFCLATKHLVIPKWKMSIQRDALAVRTEIVLAVSIVKLCITLVNCFVMIRTNEHKIF